MIYLDYAAATPLDDSVLKAMRPYFSERFYNPSATYLPAQGVHQDLEKARGIVAHWLGARPAEVIFTAGATEANNLAIRGVMDQFADGNIVVSSIEHESVLAPAHKYECREAPVSAEGILDVDKLVDLVDDKTVLVSVMYANNEIGVVQPLRQISLKLEEIRKSRKNGRPLYFHTDAAQAANYLDLHAARLGVDMLTINGGKIYGPKQSGALFVSSRVDLKPFVLGGGQERGIRSGTENVAGCVGLAAALDLAQKGRNYEAARLQNLQEIFFDLIEKSVPGAKINGSRKRRLPNNIHITVPGVDNERLLIQLEEKGILAAAGSACSASSEEPSHVLRAMGISEADARASLRFTLGRQTTEAQVREVVKTFPPLV
jgi:cysteine desulfurase